MKKPYLTQFERQLIVNETLTGDIIMLRFRYMQLLKTMEFMKNPDYIYKFFTIWILIFIIFFILFLINNS